MGSGLIVNDLLAYNVKSGLIVSYLLTSKGVSGLIVSGLLAYNVESGLIVSDVMN